MKNNLQILKRLMNYRSRGISSLIIVTLMYGKIDVNNIHVTIMHFNNDDDNSLIDILKVKNGESFFIKG